LSTGDSRGVDLSPTLSDERKDLSSKVTLQRSNGIEFGMPFCDPTSNVVLGSRHREFLKAIARSPLPARNWFCLTMPLGLRPGVDYLSVFSADNFGLGAIATEPSSPYVSGEGVVGMLTDRADFFFTHEREIAFRKWISAERPDVTLVRGLRQSRAAGAACQRLLAENDDLDCVFVAWDVPALSILSAMRKGARSLPMITVDLGNEIAAELRRDGPLKGHRGATPPRSGRGRSECCVAGSYRSIAPSLGNLYRPVRPGQTSARRTRPCGTRRRRRDDFRRNLKEAG
jgi:hypothetical protein